MSKPACEVCGKTLICPGCAGKAGGYKGGLTTGAAKARSPEQARAAVNTRWAKVRAAKSGGKKQG